VQSMLMSNGDLMIFLRRPISLGLMCFTALIVAGSIYSSLKHKREALTGDLEV